MTGQNGNSKDLYALLGVERDASQGQIKSEYRWLAKKFHPDTNQGDSRSAKRFQEINDAYGVISNPALRAAYDSSRPGPAERASSEDPDYSKAAPEKPAPPTKKTYSSSGQSSRPTKLTTLSSGAIFALTSVGIVVVAVLAFSSLGANSNSATTEAKVSSSAAAPSATPSSAADTSTCRQFLGYDYSEGTISLAKTYFLGMTVRDNSWGVGRALQSLTNRLQHHQNQMEMVLASQINGTGSAPEGVDWDSWWAVQEADQEMESVCLVVLAN